MSNDTQETTVKTKRLAARDRVIHIYINEDKVPSASTNIQTLDGVRVVFAFPEGQQVREILVVQDEQGLKDMQELAQEALRVQYSRARWAEDVAAGDTDLGYDQWFREQCK